MKPIHKYLSPVSKLKKPLYIEVQNGETEHVKFHTLDIADAKSKYKYGWISTNEEYNYICLIAFDSVKEYEDLLMCDPGMYEDLEDLDINMSVTIDEGTSDSIYTRIW